MQALSKKKPTASKGEIRRSDKLGECRGPRLGFLAKFLFVLWLPGTIFMLLQSAHSTHWEPYIVAINDTMEPGANVEVSGIQQTKRTADIEKSSRVTLDPICGGCRTSIGGSRKETTCGLLGSNIASSKNLSLVEAMTVLVEHQHNEKCQYCLPQNCDDQAKEYWRYDDAAPTILAAQSSYLASIPDQWRIPKDILVGNGIQQTANLKTFFSDPQNVYPARRYLFEYNPSIALIPTEQMISIPGQDTPVYLASYRLSTQQNCWEPNITLAMIGGSWDNRPRKQDFLGLALLRKDLSVIQDVIVFMPAHFGRHEDYRLFALKGQLYVASNCAMLPLWVTSSSSSMPDVLSMEGKVMVETFFPSDLRVLMGNTTAYCSDYWKDIGKSKNLNYFVDENGYIVVEMYPLPHMVNNVVNLTAKMQAMDSHSTTTRDQHIPNPSYYTREELDLGYQHSYFESPFEFPHGSACCVPFTDPRPSSSSTSSGNLLLGVLHVKTPHSKRSLQGIVKGNRYLSQFYAFEATPPYKVVALSGYWCLPANPSSQVLDKRTDKDNNPLIKLSEWMPLDMAGTNYNCPAIHFVTSIIEKAGDASKLIISYGVNDCTAWFVEVEKTEIINLLFRSPRHKR
jgi:hypothetical protein